jgi:hypothetical protein
VKDSYIESFNGKLRDYNHRRPHSALDDRTAAELAATCATAAAMREKKAAGHSNKAIGAALISQSVP